MSIVSMLETGMRIGKLLNLKVSDSHIPHAPS